MLLQTFSVENGQGDQLDLPLQDISNGFIVKNIKGLAPVKATLVSSSFANLDGEQYHTARREPRNIIVTLGLDPDYSISSAYELRAQLYSFLMPKTEALLKFRMFDRFSESFVGQYLDVQINCVIESFEDELFSKDPEVTVSLMGYAPNFVDPVPVIFEAETTNALAEDLLAYVGSVETGVMFRLLVDRSLSEFAIYHRTPDNRLRTANFQYDLLAGDEVRINSVPGSKQVILIRDAAENRILYAYKPQSSWLELFPGNNNIRVYASGAPIPYKIEYTNKYGGL